MIGDRPITCVFEATPCEVLTEEQVGSIFTNMQQTFAEQDGVRWLEVATEPIAFGLCTLVLTGSVGADVNGYGLVQQLEGEKWCQSARLRNTYESALLADDVGEPPSLLGDVAGVEEQIKLSVDSLQPMDQAQDSKVLVLPGFLSAAETQDLVSTCEKIEAKVGAVGRWGDGGWQTCYMNTDGAFAKGAPKLHAKLMQRVKELDAREWQLLQGKSDVRMRCVEYHTVQTGGALADKNHYDWGSLLTLDIMLSSSNEFQGGGFYCTDEAGEEQKQPFGDGSPGDAIIFCSHKKHHVLPVESGRRRVVVIEFWQGMERECSHRCDRHWGVCPFVREQAKRGHFACQYLGQQSSVSAATHSVSEGSGFAALP